MKSEQEFLEALSDKEVPILVLDQKWHRLFAIHGKTDAIKSLEQEENRLLMKQGQLNTRLKELKKVKSKLMNHIVDNMDTEEKTGDEDQRHKEMDQDARLLDEVKEEMTKCEDELLELPKSIQETNRKLMLASMEYCYEKLRTNKEEAEEISNWITDIRIQLKKNIIKKQNREINNREIYSYMHDILGHSILDLFDIQYEEELN